MTRREFYKRVFAHHWRENRSLVLVTGVWLPVIAFNVWQRDWSSVILLVLLTLSLVVVLAADYVIDQLGTENARLRYALDERHRDDGGEGA